MSKKSILIVEEYSWGNGPLKGEPVQEVFARIPVPLPLPRCEFGSKAPVGEILRHLYWKSGGKTITMRQVKEVIRRQQVTEVLTGDKWALYHQMVAQA